MKTSDFHFDLPRELIAQEPANPRDSARLMTLDRQSGSTREFVFRELPELLRPDDLLVLNDSRVLPARLFGRKESGGSVEMLLLERREPGVWTALLRASKRPKAGSCITFGEGLLEAEVVEPLGEGKYLVRLHSDGNPEEAVERLGIMPLPPYIARETPRPEDREWYQTVYADREKTGSVAAPTAGLHFTEPLLEELDLLGVERVKITLHVGLGTFLPVRVKDPATHRMHSESYEITPETAETVNAALDAGRRVVAVGTTSARVLEHAGRSGRIEAGRGATEIFIYPGFDFKVVGALLTNFHLPESTLLMLLCAFAGQERVLDAYARAVLEEFRFYSYGDAMFVY